MSEITVALDAGHGGSDPGAKYNNRLEKDDVLNLTKAVGDILENNGVNVYYVRMDDEYETPFKKATDANNAGADFFVSIHRNSSEYPNQYSGIESLVFRDSSTAYNLANNINKELANVGFNNIGISERPNLVVLRRTSMPAALVEVGFINTDADNALFDSKFNEIAQAIADGILNTIYSGATKTDAEAPGDYTAPDNFNRSSGYDQSDNYDRGSGYDQSDNYDRSSGYSQNDNYNQNNGYNQNDNYNRSNSYDRNNDSFNQNNSSNYNRNDDFNRNNSYDQNDNYNRSDNLNRSSDSLNRGSGYNQTDNFNNSDNNYMPRSNEMSYDKLYRVQVGAYKNKENADRLLNSLLVEGFPAFMIQEDGYYKVQVGAFQVLTNAIKMELRLRHFRYNTYIVYD